MGMKIEKLSAFIQPESLGVLPEKSAGQPALFDFGSAVLSSDILKSLSDDVETPPLQGCSLPKLDKEYVIDDKDGNRRSIKYTRSGKVIIITQSSGGIRTETVKEADRTVIKTFLRNTLSEKEIVHDDGNKFAIKYKDGKIHIHKHYKKSEDTGEFVLRSKTVKGSDDKSYTMVYSFSPQKVKQTAESAPVKSVNEDLQIDGKISNKVIQGQTGDCWLLSGVLALSKPSGGRNIIKESIIANDDGSVTVRFKGAGRDITISADEIKAHDTDKDGTDAYSNGDNDMLVLELAYEKLRMEKYGKSLYGGQADEIWKALVPNYKITTYSGSNIAGVIDEIIENRIAKRNSSALCFSLDGINLKHSAKLKNGAEYSYEQGSHAFYIDEIMHGSIIFKNPHNAQKSLRMSIEEFKKLTPRNIQFLEILD